MNNCQSDLEIKSNKTFMNYIFLIVI